MLRRDALKIWKAGVAAASPAAAVKRVLASRDLSGYERIFVVGAGKATGAMARAAEQVLGKRIIAGCVNVPDSDTAKLQRIEKLFARHPKPDARGVAGSKRIAAICGEAGERDLVLSLISGGASALMPYPAEGLTLSEKRAATDLVYASGASIQEFNIVRKHLSRIKGGQLARIAAPAHVLSLILSDVVGDDLSSIGSGPTAPDPSTCADALAVLDRYGLRGSVPAAVRARLEHAREETPKPGDSLFAHVENVIVGSNQQSLEAAAACAESLGYRTLILSSTLQGEAKDVARVHATIAKQIRQHGQPVAAPACLISGGETTVTIPKGSKGKGGRNQEFALAAAIEVAGADRIAILSAGTDGIDGPTDAAGAVVDGRTALRRTEAAAALAAHNAYPFLDATGSLIRTGPTGTNVMDLNIIIVS